MDGRTLEGADSEAPLSSTTLKISGRPVRVGFVALIDAAPIIAAHELGYFSDEGLDVIISREIGWANVRDKLAFNRLDASHALIGQAVQSALGDGSAGVPIHAVMALGTGGDGITISQRLVNAGVTSGSQLRKYITQRPGDSRPVLAHVSTTSVHHYLLRQWLFEQGIDPDREVRLCVLPPPQMASHMADRQIDGFCAGEPWNSLAHGQGIGRIVALTSDIVPAHPDKVVAVNQLWAHREPETVRALIRAILRGSTFCATDDNLPAVAEMLSEGRYLGIPSHTILGSLRMDRTFGQKEQAMARTPNWVMRSFSSTFPSQTYAAWYVGQMMRWGHVSQSVDPWTVASQCIDPAMYRLASADLGLTCPSVDWPEMAIGQGKMLHRPATRDSRPARDVARV